MPSISPHPATKTFSDSVTAVQSSLSHIDPRLAENATVVFIERIFMDAASIFLVLGALYACAVHIFPCLSKNLPVDTPNTMLSIQEMLRLGDMPIRVHKEMLGRYQSLQRDIAIVFDSEKDNKFDAIRWVSRFRAWARVNKEAHALLKDAKLSAITKGVELPHKGSVLSNEHHRCLKDIDRPYNFSKVSFCSDSRRSRTSKPQQQLELTALSVAWYARDLQRKAKTFRPLSAARSGTRLIGDFVQ